MYKRIIAEEHTIISNRMEDKIVENNNLLIKSLKKQF